jgi:hypothetical protein
MTGTELLNLALPLMFAADSAEYQDAAIPVINLLLSDCFEVNNSIRKHNGDAEFTEIPEIDTLSDELPYEDAINRKVLPFGLAGYLYAEDDATVATLRMNKYEYEKAQNYKAEYVQVNDYYTEGDE